MKKANNEQPEKDLQCQAELLVNLSDEVALAARLQNRT